MGSDGFEYEDVKELPAAQPDDLTIEELQRLIFCSLTFEGAGENDDENEQMKTLPRQ